MTHQANIAFDYIDTQAGVDALVPEIAQIPLAAIDTEADSYYHYYTKVCLLQISTAAGDYIIDPLAGLNLEALFKELTVKKLIFHDAGNDLRLMKKCFGFLPAGQVFDTLTASKVLGADTLNLASMLHKHFHITTSKSNQTADWSKRPLQEHLLRYAIQDTHYLIRLADILEEELKQKDRLTWHQQLCQKTVQDINNAQDAAEPNRDWRIKGSSGLGSRQLNFLKHLWQWREQQAKKIDMAPFRVLTNDKLLELARRAASQKEPHFEGLFRNHARYKTAVVEVLYASWHTPHTDWPKPKRAERSEKPSAELLGRIDMIKKIAAQIADQLHIPADILLSRPALTMLAQNGLSHIQPLRDKGMLLPWQADALLPELEKHAGALTGSL